MKISNTKLDQLGDRIRSQNMADGDLQLLENYRRSFTSAYRAVVGTLQNALQLEPAGRPQKSTSSISDKLRRGRLRLSRMQDIAGCRVVVSDLVKQDEVMARLAMTFEEASIVDRREKPSHGYRAVHVVVRQGGVSVEIQVRTGLQHAWAQLSEWLSDAIDPSIKYGGGPVPFSSKLARLSQNVVKIELLESSLREADPLSKQVSMLAWIKSDFEKLLRKMIERGVLWEDK
jgi:putative GTP pyrophosphokinase